MDKELVKIISVKVYNDNTIRFESDGLCVSEIRVLNGTEKIFIGLIGEFGSNKVVEIDYDYNHDLNKRF